MTIDYRRIFEYNDLLNPDMFRYYAFFEAGSGANFFMILSDLSPVEFSHS